MFIIIYYVMLIFQKKIYHLNLYGTGTGIFQIWQKFETVPVIATEKKPPVVAGQFCLRNIRRLKHCYGKRLKFC